MAAVEDDEEGMDVEDEEEDMDDMPLALRALQPSGALPRTRTAGV